MSFWKSIFGKKEDEVLPDFRNWVVLAIEIIGRNGDKMDDNEIANYLINKGIPKFDADEIIIFLPTAFCRKLLPEINWPSNYVDFYSEHKKVKRKYKDNWRYIIIEQVAEQYWNGSLENSKVLNIAGRSAEFNAINNALNKGSKLENLEMSESCIIRYE